MANFNPVFSITNSIANNLIEIERVKETVKSLPINPKLLNSLRETAKVSAIHYSTQIEGNKLTQKEVSNLINHKVSNTGRIRDEKEIKGYYAALDYVEKLIKDKSVLTEDNIKYIHALVSGGSNSKLKKNEYRQAQNVITDSLTGGIVYMPPEAKDVEGLMKEFVRWINSDDDIPVPIKAAIIHYQFVTIHPYFDGNGRTARLLTTFFLHRYGYDLKGIYSLEEYYAKDLQGYYDALTIGNSHNYYLGRQNADITKWVEYFINGMAKAFNAVCIKAQKQENSKDEFKILRELDAKQREILTLFETQKFITSKDIAEFFKFSARSARLLASQWVDKGFLTASGNGKQRKYKLDELYENIL